MILAIFWELILSQTICHQVWIDSQIILTKIKWMIKILNKIPMSLNHQHKLILASAYLPLTSTTEPSFLPLTSTTEPSFLDPGRKKIKNIRIPMEQLESMEGTISASRFETLKPWDLIS